MVKTDSLILIYLNNTNLLELPNMSIVRFNKTYKVCATCAYWQGKRQAENGGIVFNNRDSGICGGVSFKDWSMGATSTCIQWQHQDESGKKDSVDTQSVNKMTPAPPS
jgi:hypothetical protein